LSRNSGDPSFVIHIDPLGGWGLGQAGHGHDVPAQDDQKTCARSDLARQIVPTPIPSG